MIVAIRYEIAPLHTYFAIALFERIANEVHEQGRHFHLVRAGPHVGTLDLQAAPGDDSRLLESCAGFDHGM